MINLIFRNGLFDYLCSNCDMTEIALLKKGLSLRNVSAITGTSVTTIRKVKDKFVTMAEAPKVLDT